MKLFVTFQVDEDGMVVAECPQIPGCISQGRTRAEAEANVADAIRKCLEARRELGLPLILDTRELEIA